MDLIEEVKKQRRYAGCKDRKSSIDGQPVPTILSHVSFFVEILDGMQLKNPLSIVARIEAKGELERFLRKIDKIYELESPHPSNK